MKSEQVSVAMAVYNGEKYLSEQVQSVLSQTHGALEFLAIDDASSDSSFDLLQRFASSDKRVKIWRNKKSLGPAANFLNVVSKAGGNYVCYCDQDDFWRKDKIEVLLRLMKENENNRLVYSDLEVCDEMLRRLRASFWTQARVCPEAGELDERVFLKNIAPGCSMMFDREVQKAMSRFSGDAPFMHDHLAWILAASMGRVDFTSEKLVQYRQHAQNAIGAFRRPSASKRLRREHIIEQMDYFCQKMPGSGKFNMEKLRRFTAALENGGVRRPEFLPYFLYFRADRPQQKLLGVVEWLTA